MAAEVKVWRVSPTAQAHFEVRDNLAVMAGNGKNFVVVNQDGTTIRGPFSIAAMGTGQRTGGLWVRMSEWTGMFPSSVVTPIPQVLPVPPIGLVKNIAAGVVFGLAFLAG